MKRRIPWIDMIGFYLLLPFNVGFLSWCCRDVYQEGGGVCFLVAQWFFYLFALFLLCSSIGVFMTKLVGKMGNAFRETWDEMVDTMIGAQSSR